MISHRCIGLCDLYRRLSEEIEILGNSRKPQSPLSKLEKTRIATTLVSHIDEEICALRFFEIGASVETFRVQSLYAKLIENERFTPETLNISLKEIRNDLTIRLSHLKFAYIPSPNDKYFEQDKLFGEKVYDHFDSARLDIKDAGNCIAAELYTAAVFHLMRVAEFGLRYVADKLNVELFDKGNPRPIEYATWDKVLQGIQGKIKLIREKQSHGPQKNEELQFYSNAGENAMFIKDLWRNDASHTRKRYNEQEALGVFTRIKDFMVGLAAGNP